MLVSVMSKSAQQDQKKIQESTRKQIGRKTNESANRNAYHHKVTGTHTKTGGATFSFFSLCALRFELVAPELSVDLRSVSRGR